MENLTDTRRMTAEEIAYELGLPAEVIREVLEEEAAEEAARPKSLLEIAEALARDEGKGKPVTVERVRQIEARAMEKCRLEVKRRRMKPSELFYEPEPPRYQATRKLR